MKRLTKYDWLDKYISDQTEQKQAIKNIIKPCSLADICEISEMDEMEIENIN